MDIRADEISRIIREQIKDYGQKVTVAETGTVLSVGDGIARVYGLEGALAGELVEFKNGVKGRVSNDTKFTVLHDALHLTPRVGHDFAIDMVKQVPTVFKEMTQVPVRRIARLTTEVRLPVAKDHPHREALERAALTCPVHQSLHPDVDKPLTFVWA